MKKMTKTGGVKIVTIGGGSSYTPELMEGFIKRYDKLPIREIWLVDIEEGREKLRIVGAMAQRMWDASPYPVTVHTTLDRREALKDADFVTTQFRVGLLYARIKDERIPLSYDILGQETNGAGGIFKAFRTIPVMLDIIEDMKELCPHAWLINFTNPSGIVTEAVIRYGHWDRILGLCNVPVMAMKEEAPALGVSPDSLIYRFAGLNHFHWHRVWDTDGHDMCPAIIEKMKDGNIGVPKNIFDMPFNQDMLKKSDLIPCLYHLYYFRQEDMLRHYIEEARHNGTRAEVVKETEDRLFKLYEDPNLNYKPRELELRGGAYYSDAACESIASIYANEDKIMVVSTRNCGAVPDLPEDCVAEVSSVIGRTGPMPLAFGKLPMMEAGWLKLMKSMELLVCEAAVTGDYATALQAFLLNPLIPSGSVAEEVLNELLLAHKKYLPQFADKIAELEEAGVTIQDETVRKLMAEGK
ncbi:MAG: 6-phospho-beta-glucosidase [Eubacteriaceae bacterium]|jgi:6-phospho-beta-glucosidase